MIKNSYFSEFDVNDCKELLLSSSGVHIYIGEGITGMMFFLLN